MQEPRVAPQVPGSTAVMLADHDKQMNAIRIIQKWQTWVLLLAVYFIMSGIIDMNTAKPRQHLNTGLLTLSLGVFLIGMTILSAILDRVMNGLSGRRTSFKDRPKSTTHEST